MYEYFEDAIESEERDIEMKVVFPSKTTFLGKRWAGWRKNDRERTVENCENRLVMTHNDADGLVSGALFKDFFTSDEDDESPVDVLEVDYEHIESSFENILEASENIQELYVSDLNLDEVYPVIEDVANNIDKFVWIDHHEWGDKEQALRDMGIEITINQDRCAAGLVYQYLKGRGYESSETIKETVRLTEDHDLWNHEMESIELGNQNVCISKAFSQMAFFADSDTFMDTILDYGMSFMNYEDELLRDGKDAGFIAEKENEHQEKVEYIINNETTIETIGETTVAFSHGRANPGELSDRLIENEGMDLLVHTKPAYPVKASLRGSENFQECHTIAGELGGGGHEKAAGCKPDGIAEEPMEFFEYITSRGEPLKQEIRTVIKNQLE
jgi:oligoribonuclease NrnB/cAMP/cGMP phosphodiesterase (DHH superfamily)